MKRVFDLAFSALALLFLCIPLALIWLAVRLGLGSPAIFRQMRPGLGGYNFEILKFRTMTETRDANGSLLPDIERLTGFGRFLRATSLDELPSLWNVLKGDMSMVGPRPLLVEYMDLYNENQARRHEVRPGITGWAQVNGRNAISWEDKFALDVWYVDNHSMLLDLKVLWLTAKSVVRREGISQSGQATMEKFTGEKL